MSLKQKSPHWAGCVRDKLINLTMICLSYEDMFFRTSDEQTEHVSCTRPISNERLIPFHETCDNPEQPQGEDRKESNGWDEHCGDSEKAEEEGDGTTEDERENKAEKRQIETNCDPDRDLTGVEDYKEAEYSDEEDNRENEMTKDEEMKIEEECSKKKTSGGVEMVEKPIEVMDGHILLGQVWWNTLVKVARLLHRKLYI